MLVYLGEKNDKFIYIRAAVLVFLTITDDKKYIHLGKRI